MSELKEGTLLESIFFASGDDTEISVGKFQCESIEIVDVTGQAAFVPWAKVISTDKTVRLFNCAMLEGVQLRTDTP